MIRLAAMLMLSTMTASCAYPGGYGFFGLREPIRQPAAIAIPERYTKAEVDAINAELTCRANARTTLQAQRCGVRR